MQNFDGLHNTATNSSTPTPTGGATHSNEYLFKAVTEQNKFEALHNRFAEKDFVAEKIKNSQELDYPKEKLHIVWVTDGSDDGTPDEIKKYVGVTVHHLSLIHISEPTRPY